MFWHSDKAPYQRELGERIAALWTQVARSQTTSEKWFRGCFSALCSHWNRVDNYRINKYLMLLRFLFRNLILYVCITATEEALAFYHDLMLQQLLCPRHSVERPLGVPLQACDVIMSEISWVREELQRNAKESEGDNMNEDAMLRPFATALERSGEKDLR